MNPATVAACIDYLNRVLHAHAGGVELVEAADDGEVVVRFTGMCTGCAYRSVTMSATVRRALMQVPGVTAVRALGGRLSEESEARMAYYFDAPLGAERTTLPLPADFDKTLARLRTGG